jgi:hypothetical protein
MRWAVGVGARDRTPRSQHDLPDQRVARLFDGNLIGNVESDGFVSRGVSPGAVPLLCATVVVGVLAFVRARQLRGLR